MFPVDVALPSEAARTALNDRLSSVRDLLSPPGRSKLDNFGLTMALLDFNVMEVLSPSAGAHSSQCSTEWKLFTVLMDIDIAIQSMIESTNIGWEAETTITSIQKRIVHAQRKFNTQPWHSQKPLQRPTCFI